MEIIFIPKHTSDDLMNFPIEEIESSFLEEIKKDLEFLDADFELKEVNLGTGADWALILAVLNGVTTVFLLGDKIEKGIEGWLKIGKRLKSLFQKTDAIYIDLEAAKLIALQYLAERYDLKSFSIVKESTEEVLNLSGMLGDRKPWDFIAKPFSIYFLTFRINDNVKTMLAVRSDGKIKELYSYDENFWHPF
ncbi:hypothetical protein [Salinimicrobium sediminilitoris]|uniref:hypothetical protein n=1 Tax=Salinimicrobium sediminilitoris TaxID=2876715 RepID=UPI001E4A0A48|nr:hypothetical protein [Salinimicrobium sediminilitoris]MCC8360610.1 hypothetical protein [Salinimicrobium sediminilitoris]